ncbi:Polyketide cyclase / dehydrase and lipid transport [Janthinobacterium lividum]|uniref:Polyketide cyclase / dehydrase and lipid transport n=1 Tax=Janthinobacterium lividum TaxID=29581 RepID=A0AB38CA49_9BURK|nr:SRPBCC family protein [Janthinobacterium lividum]SFX80771.1 Polyketide cyclase / dehydrase and lipid transport [Janthinobacterium lividum]
MQIEESIHIAVPPTVVDQIWSEVDRWHQWDPDTKQARLNGPFAVGTHGRIVPSKGMGIPMLVTERSAGRSFTVEGYIPLFRIHFEHTVVAADGGSEVVHRVWFTGALAFLFGPGVARQVRDGLPRTMRSLKAYAEKRNETIHDGEAAGPARQQPDG